MKSRDDDRQGRCGHRARNEQNVTVNRLVPLVVVHRLETNGHLDGTARQGHFVHAKSPPFPSPHSRCHDPILPGVATEERFHPAARPARQKRHAA